MTRIFFLLALAALGSYAQGQLPCPASPSPAQGQDFRNQDLTGRNFSRQDLTNANFSGKTLTGVYFGGANLTGANFSGATFANDPSNPTLVTDFSFANLDTTCFIGAKFTGPTYFTYAMLTCPDFSQIDMSNGNIIFGGDGLNINNEGRQCRTAFRFSTMNCEFVNDWPVMDLSNAIVKACYSQLTGANFSNAVMPNVDLTGAVLDDAKFVQANLSGATLNNTSLQNADLSHAQLQGAKLSNANLTGATLYHAFLANSTGDPQSATVQYSHLKNVNLSFAELTGVHFDYTNFYGDTAKKTCNTTGQAPGTCAQPGPGSDNYEGFTCGCASAHSAVMTDTYFNDTYLFGVDFTSAQIKGVDFSRAVLTGANFSGAVLSVGANGNSATMLRAFLQGANLQTSLTNVDFTDAFVDFTSGGNDIYIFLAAGNHNTFFCPPSSPCAPPSGTDVCVALNYDVPTTVPTTDSTITCPDATTGPCGASGSKWASRLSTVLGTPPTGVPPAWYDSQATYTSGSPDATICNNKGSAYATTSW